MKAMFSNMVSVAPGLITWVKLINALETGPAVAMAVDAYCGVVACALSFAGSFALSIAA